MSLLRGLRVSTSSVWIFVLAAGICFSGCSGKGDRPELGTVEGVVRLDGAPLPGVVISFQPTSGRGSDAVTDTDGRYSLNYLRDVKGAKIGAHRVAISHSEDESSPSRNIKIPKKYGAETTLEANVAAGKNSIDFDLSSK